MAHFQNPLDGEFDINNPPELIISQVEIDAYNNLEYARLRKVEYDKLNQDELRYDDMINGTNNWSIAIEAIKLQFPKLV